MEQKRAQLRQLSQSLQACSVMVPTAAPMPIECAVSTPEQVMAGDQTIGDAIEGIHCMSDSQAALCDADAAKPDVGQAASPSSQTDIDPMTRLNAIKLRLAKQIENH